MPTLTPLRREMLKALALSGSLAAFILISAAIKPYTLLLYIGSAGAGLVGSGVMSLLFINYTHPAKPRTPDRLLREEASRKVIPIVGAVTGVLLFWIYV